MSQTPDTFSPRERARIEATTLEVGRFIFERCHFDRPNVFDRAGGTIGSWPGPCSDESVKVQMFRFVDVLPMLNTSEAMTQHLHEYFDDVRESASRGGAAGLGRGHSPRRWPAGPWPLPPAATRRATPGASSPAPTRPKCWPPPCANASCARLHARHPGRSGHQRSRGRPLSASLYRPDRAASPRRSTAWPEVPQIDRGRVRRAAASECLGQAFGAGQPVRPDRSGGTTERVADDCARCCAARARAGVRQRRHGVVPVKDLTLAIFQQMLAEPSSATRRRRHRHSSVPERLRPTIWQRCAIGPRHSRHARFGCGWSKEPIGITRRCYAQSQGWPIPVFQQKWETDANFERLTRFLLRNHAFLRPALGSHNIRSLAHGMAVARHLGVPASGLELQMLYGMADPEKQVLVDLGYRLRIYMPYGELFPGMAYLVRRLLENTSNDSFLKAGFSEHVRRRSC